MVADDSIPPPTRRDPVSNDRTKAKNYKPKRRGVMDKTSERSAMVHFEDDGSVGAVWFIT